MGTARLTNHIAAQIVNELLELPRGGVADSVRHVDSGGAGCDRARVHLIQKRWIRPECVFAWNGQEKRYHASEALNKSEYLRTQHRRTETWRG